MNRLKSAANPTETRSIRDGRCSRDQALHFAFFEHVTFTHELVFRTSLRNPRRHRTHPSLSPTSINIMNAQMMKGSGARLGARRAACVSRVPAVRVVAVSAAPIAAHAAAPAVATERTFNFAAGPAILPLDVLEQAKADLINWKGSGMSIMEVSHRGPEFDSIIKKAEADLRTLLAIPTNYKVLFLQGGASTQYASIPLNFAAHEDLTDHIVTGAWSKKVSQSNPTWGPDLELRARVPGRQLSISSLICSSYTRVLP